MAAARGRALGLVLQGGRQADAVVVELQMHGVGGGPDPQHQLLRLTVAQRVAQAFLRGAVQRQRQLGCQRAVSW